MLTRVLSAGLLAGLLAGLAIAILQNFTTTPLILAAEVYENAAPQKAAAAGALGFHAVATVERPPVVLAHGDQHDAHGDGASNVWAPESGLERLAFTTATTVAAAIGFAFLLIGGMTLSGTEIAMRTSMAWAACGFVVTGLAPAAGMPPELPGMAAADLIDRQTWWFLTAVLTAFGLWLFFHVEDVRIRALAVALLIVPHLYGAPHVEGIEPGKLPAELAARFAALSLVVHAALWMATGYAVGSVWALLDRSPQTEPTAQS